jgi:predicted aldo/keto reductase-like oxidoreductase
MKEKNMLYRAVGKTGKSVSVVGLGTEYLDEKPYPVVEETIKAALDNGVNIMDVFMPGEEVRKNIGKALAGQRDKVFIQGHICSTDANQQYDISRELPVARKYFEDLLRFLRTDYIDFGMLFFIDSEGDFRGAFESPILEYALGLKEKGVIRHLGASSHTAATAKRIVETGLVDLLLFSTNPAFDMLPPDDGGRIRLDPERASLYRLCESRNVGIHVMKTLGAGKLLSPAYTPLAQPLTVGQCIHYALTRPAVASALIGCQSRAQVEEAVRYTHLSDAEKDYSPALENIKADFRGGCFYCRHCLPCPAEIDIARVNRNLDLALLDEKHIPPKVLRNYKALRRHGSDCVACGSCEARCPFGVPVIKKMERATALFGM